MRNKNPVLLENCTYYGNLGYLVHFTLYPCLLCYITLCLLSIHRPHVIPLERLQAVSQKLGCGSKLDDLHSTAIMKQINARNSQKTEETQSASKVSRTIKV